jgi:hypothetical protein
MNCKPGDLAVIVRTHGEIEPATKQFLGRVVRLRASTERAEGICWNFEDQPLRGSWHGADVSWYNLPDDWLRPIRDPGDDATDETLLRLGKPVPTVSAPKLPQGVPV